MKGNLAFSARLKEKCFEKSISLSGGSRGGDLHAEPQRDPRKYNGLALPQANRLDVCHQRHAYDFVR